jgi:cation diffusion facilitator CzcD-associated flavoprotein CzcO
MPKDALAKLESRVRADLYMIRFPDRQWVIPTEGPEDQHVYDVVIVGAGHCGLTLAFALQRRGITNIQVFDAEEPGRQGPWTTYGRMLTLRSPKHFNGPDLDIPSLTCEAWYRARYGDESWDTIEKIPKEHWQEYLLWFQRVTSIPVSYRTRVTSVLPAQRTHEVEVESASGPDRVYVRKIVFATGADGSGHWNVPATVRDSLPAERYNQAADDIDFSALAGRRIGILGGGASAYDNAATALEQGAASVDLFFRRPELHRVNPHKWTEFSGFLDHFRDLPDEWRWRFMRHILPLNEPPPPETFKRATRHPNFSLHLGSTWESMRLVDNKIEIHTSRDAKHYFDHLIIAVGLAQDLRVRPEIRNLQPYIARWADKYTPPAGERHEGMSQFPYLGPNFEYVERAPGAAPYLSDIYNFTAAATVSHGPSGASINGMKQAAHRIADGISRDLFISSIAQHYEDLRVFAVPEMDVPWPPMIGNDHPELSMSAAKNT